MPPVALRTTSTLSPSLSLILSPSLSPSGSPLPAYHPSLVPPVTLCAPPRRVPRHASRPATQRWKSGHSGPPSKDDQGKFVCERCERAFENISGLGSHRSRCDGGVWRCEWCVARYEETSGKVRRLSAALAPP